MWPFKPKKRRVFFGRAYACQEKHVQHSDMDGVCMTCGKPVRPAVATGEVSLHLGWRPYEHGFVRWDEQSFTQATQ